MQLPPSPRVVITGAGSGLGRALALELGRRGARMLIAEIDRERGSETAQLVIQEGGQAEFLATDVGEYSELERAARLAEQLWGGTDLLINNAGVAAGGAVGDIPLADWEWCLRVNLWGPIHGCQAFIPGMKARGSGFILNVASAAGIASLPLSAPYNAGKAAIISLSETLQSELAPHAIAVSVVCPTYFQSRIMEDSRSCSSERQRQMVEELFRRAKSSAADVARSALAGLEAGQFLIIPQLDGRLIWWAKRLAPTLYYRLLRWEHEHDIAGRWLLPAKNRAQPAP